MYILDGMSLATDGFASPVEGGDYCLAPFALISLGLIVLEVDDDLGKLADPSTSSWREPWDLDYYRHKYRREIAKVTKQPVKEVIQEVEAEPVRPNRMRELLEYEAQLPAQELARLEAKNNQVELDILELQAYIREVRRGIESGLAQELAAQEMAAAAQEALIARLEENVVEARETLLAAMEARRRHQNQIAAIEAVIRVYF